MAEPKSFPQNRPEPELQDRARELLAWQAGALMGPKLTALTEEKQSQLGVSRTTAMRVAVEATQNEALEFVAQFAS